MASKLAKVDQEKLDSTSTPKPEDRDKTTSTECKAIMKNSSNDKKESKQKSTHKTTVFNGLDTEDSEVDFGGIEITEEQLDQIKKSWQILDEDEDGRITEEEILRGAQLIGLNPTVEDVRGWLGETDVDGDCSLDYYEYEKLMRQHYAVASFQEHELRKAFAYFDTKGKGFLNRRQLYRALRNCGDQLSDEECDEFFSLADKNKDGVISLEEFVVLFTEI
ncbi:calmodulin-like [Mytilus californianus]|uniref:calmodulin-like n=1 Tax=Mytilus californianus TaxID=6549 RepID=UPI0022464496|nr:calmodulin-like [Mytilus californianus]